MITKRTVLFSAFIVIAFYIFSLSTLEAQVKDWRPLLTAGKVSTPPDIDGRLDDECWKNSITISPFIMKHAKSSPYEKTLAYACWDEKKLYVAFKCFDNNLNPDYGLTHKIIAVSKTRDDDNLWKDDCVELFVKSDTASENYCQIIVNSINNVFDRSHSEGKKWDSGAKIKVLKTTTFWTVEMAVPLMSFSKHNIKDGTQWLINFCREQKAHQEDSCWSPTFGSFLNVQHLGRIIFNEQTIKLQPPEKLKKLTPGENTLTLSAQSPINKEIKITTNIAFPNGKTYSKSRKFRLKAGQEISIKHSFILDEAELDKRENNHFKFNYQVSDCIKNKLLYQSAAYIQSTEKYSPFKTKVFLYGNSKPLYLAEDTVHVLRFDISRAKNLNESKIKDLELNIKLPGFVQIVNPLDGQRDPQSNPPKSFIHKKINSGKSTCNLYKLKYPATILYEMEHESKEANQSLLMLKVSPQTDEQADRSMKFHVSALVDGKTNAEPEREIKINLLKTPAGRKPKKIMILEWSTGMTRPLHWLTDKEKSLMFKNWKKAGFTVKALHEFGLVLYSEAEQEEIKNNGIKLMRGMPTNSQNIFDRKYVNMYLGADNYLKRNPQFKALNYENKIQDKIICSSHVADPESKYQTEFAEWVGKIAKKYNYMMYDHELPVFKNYSCCYCKRCMSEFAQQYKLKQPIKRWHLLTRYKEQWVDFKCRQNAQIMGLVKKYAHQANPNSKLVMYCGYEMEKFHSHAGINFKYCNNCVDIVTCGYGRPLERINLTKKLIAPTPLVGGELIWWRHGTFYDTTKMRPKLFRRITDSNGGMFLFYTIYVDGRFWKTVADISRLVSEYEDFFTKVSYGPNLVKVLSGGKNQDITVLKNQANERLIFIFNQTDKVKNYVIENKYIPAGAKCLDYYANKIISNPEKTNITVLPQDVKVIIIKK